MADEWVIEYITPDELNRNAEYITALRNAEAFVRTLNEIRALPEKEAHHESA